METNTSPTRLEGAARRVTRTFAAERHLEGEGFEVRRPFPVMGFEQCDPFLLLDHFGPVDLAPGEAKGAPDHPHRGFETVTYLIEGAFEHEDSMGNRGYLGPGDVQWMTAGSGVVHSEMPAKEIRERGGRLHGFQLWVNLPRRDKMSAPRYQDIPATRIPRVASPDSAVQVRVIAGEAMGARAVIETHTPISFLHFTLRPGAAFDQPIPRDHSGFLYVVSGAARVGTTLLAEGHLGTLGREGDHLAFSTSGDAATPLELLLITGVPLAEPLARYGPFVMNTRKEILQAVEDFQSGRMGRIR